MSRLNQTFFGIAFGLLGAGLIQASPAQAITTWNWSFNTSFADQFGSGTFTTADVTPTPGTLYSILGINGTYNRGGTVYPITGLSTFESATNDFKWDGSLTSPIIVTVDGFSFQAGSNDVNIYNSLGGPAESQFTNFSGGNGYVTSSSLTPVPGPLPLLGTAIAYRASRQLRRRLKASV